MSDEDPGPDTWGEAAARFDRCECARLLGLEVVAAWPGGARVRMGSRGKANPDGVIHGGAIFALADHAFGLAANSGATRQVAVSASISYLTPARGPLEAVAARVAEAGGHSLFHVRVYEGERLVATFEGIGIREWEGAAD